MTQNDARRERTPLGGRGGGRGDDGRERDTFSTGAVETQDVDPRPATPLRRRTVPLLIAALAGLAILVVVSTRGESESSVTFHQMPLTSFEGNPAMLADFSGQGLVVNFFASWCAPCRAEMPDFERVHQALGDDVMIIGVSRDINEAAWKGLVEETGITFPTFFEGADGPLFESLGVVTMPTTIFISADGEIIDTVYGALSESDLTERIGTNFGQ